MIELRSITQQSTLSARYAIIVYDEENYRTDSDRRCFATVHEVRKRGKRKTLSAGTPVSRDAVLDALNRLMKSAALSILPPHILAHGLDYVVWWSPPAARGIWFAKESPLGERQGVVPHPSLVFFAIRGELYIVATKGSERPDGKTKVYGAPYFNVWKSGRVCLGNVAIPNRADVDSTEAYSRAFFESYCTAPNEVTGVACYRGGPTALWRDLLDGRMDVFPEKALVDRDITLQQFLNHIIGARNASTR